MRPHRPLTICLHIPALVLVAVLLPAPLLARPVPGEVARQVALNWIEEQGLLSEPLKGHQFERAQPRLIRKHKRIERGKRLVGYLFDLDPEGFVIVAPDDLMVPVIAFSLTGDFPEKPCPAAEAYLGDLLGLVDLIEKKGDDAPAASVAQQWQRLNMDTASFAAALLSQGGKAEESATLGTVGPLLTTHWSQGDPYNRECPELGGEKCVVGCVAVAMAQVLRYHRHPPTGTGSHQYYWDAGAQWLSANFGSTTYDWANMPDTISSGSPSAQINAIATLLYHCGVSVNMDYGVGGSSASSSRVDDAVHQYFRHAGDAVYVRRDDYTSSEWYSMMESEIDAGRPAYYAFLQQSGGGHAVVMDGYQDGGYVHFNFGWGGLSDGFYQIDPAPDVNGWDYGHEAVIEIIPKLDVPAAYPTIQAALDHASTGSIVSVAPGTYGGPGNKDLDFGGKPITLRSEQGADSTVIDCEGSGRGFTFHSGETATSVVDGFTIRNGSASGAWPEYHGGGIHCYSDSSPTIVNCTITSCAALKGAGICSRGGSTPAIINCIVKDNSASSEGGGIYCISSDAVIVNCTIAGNSASAGGGICSDGGSPTIANSILWDNSPQQVHIASGAPVLTYCDVHDGTGEPWFGIGCIASDPLFVDAAGADYRLRSGSPCIDAGDNDSVPPDAADIDGDGDRLEPTPLDHDRYTRFEDDLTVPDTGNGTPPVVDMGACEGVGSPIYVSPGDNIQDAIDAANSGQTIVVGPGLYTGARNKDLDFEGKAITLRSGSGAALTVIDCGGSGRGFDFHSGETAAAVVDGFMIRNGSANEGGAIRCWFYSSPTITNCIITGNVAAWRGGGIHCESSSATITNCIITNNEGNKEGGGIYSYLSSPTIANCTISGNTGGSDGGGGIACRAPGSPTITNCILWGNTAPTGHEIALYSHSTLTVRYSDVQGGTGEAYVEGGCTLDLDTTNIGDEPGDDPLFATGPLGDYYLSQLAAGQDTNSPCVDAGSDTAANLGLDMLTTRTDGVPDAGTVDMGYHCSPAIFGDVDGNGVVDGLDLTAVLSAWETTSGDPLWNPAADLDGNGIVNGLDLTEVISSWTTAAAATPPAGPEPTAGGSGDPDKPGAGRGNVHKGKGNLRRK